MPAELELLLRARYPLIWLDTAEEDRAVDVICRVARTLGDEVAGWSQTYGLHDLPGPPKPGVHTDPLKILEHIRKKERRAIWILKDLGAICGGSDAAGGPSAALVRALRDTLRVAKGAGAVMVVTGNGHALPTALAGEGAVHSLALPSVVEHEAQLREVAKQLALPIDEDAAHVLSTACLGLTLDQAENIWARVRASGGRFTPADVAVVVAEKERIVRGSGYLEFVKPVSIDDVGGLVHLKSWVSRRHLGFSEQAREIGLPFPRGLLLVGVQGCGKSLTAKSVAGSWNQPLLRMDVGALMEGLVGASERNLRRSLELAERIAPCVLWIDEIEKGFSGLSAGTDAGTIMRMFGTMLTWMQEKTSPVFLLATANEIESIPPEMLRKGRFDEIFFVDLPGREQRMDIWRIHLDARAAASGDAGLLDRVDIDGLSDLSDGYNGAEIAAAVVEGAFSALAENGELTGAQIVAALTASPPLSRLRSEEIDRLRAWAQGRARGAG